jgi:transposase
VVSGTTCRRVGWLLNDRAACWALAVVWLERGQVEPLIRSAHRGNTLGRPDKEVRMFVIGIDPHKGSHTAAVLDAEEELLGELRVDAGHGQCDELLAFAGRFAPRTWAIESATGWGALLAKQLVAAGEAVVDVPPTLSARARLLDAGSNSKTDRHDARSAAVVALRHRRLQAVTALDYTAVLRLLADRHHQLTGLRTQAVCRLHAMLCLLIPGGRPRRLNEATAREALNGVRGLGLVDIERKALALDLLADIRRLDEQIARIKKRIRAAVATVDTTVTDVYGVGPVVAAIILGHTGDIGRFRSAGHYARYNATAPIEASSGPRARHRLNPRGNRQLNHALHMAAVAQIRYETPGRAYYLRKQAEGKTRKEALRALKRRISDAVYRQLVADARRR